MNFREMQLHLPLIWPWALFCYFMSLNVMSHNYNLKSLNIFVVQFHLRQWKINHSDFITYVPLVWGDRIMKRVSSQPPHDMWNLQGVESPHSSSSDLSHSLLHTPYFTWPITLSINMSQGRSPSKKSPRGPDCLLLQGRRGASVWSKQLLNLLPLHLGFWVLLLFILIVFQTRHVPEI